MDRIKIVADSTCDLSKELLQQYDISILPLMIVLGDDSFADQEEIVPDQIYEWSNINGKTPKTSSPNPGTIIDFFSKYEGTGTELIFIGLSEAMSVTCQVVRTMQKEFTDLRVHVINSMNLSTGIGLLVLRAAELVTEGMSAEEIIIQLTEMRTKVRASFIVDSLTYLYRGGRCNAVTVLLSDTLRVKPEIVVTDGVMGVNKKYRGRLEKVLMHYVSDHKGALLAADDRRVFITHSGIRQEIIDEVYEYLKNLNYFREILVTRAGGVISSHCGPNTLGVLYCEK